MRLIICLLIAVAAAFGAYALGATVWAVLDPQSAGTVLLFTIPRAIVGMILPALLAAALMVRRFAA